MSLEHLDEARARTLVALAEAAIGEDLLVKVPGFLADVDDFLGYAKPDTVTQLKGALKILENPVLRLTILGEVGRFASFSRLPLADRQELLADLKASKRNLARQVYAALTHLAASTFYGDAATWPELQYRGVSVDDPAILAPNGHPWRPGDSTPVEP